MTNKEIAGAFQELGNLMELHGENPFKIRSYQNAYLTLRKWGQPLTEMSPEDRADIPGVGKAIADKITQLLASGTMETLEKYRDVTPEGVREMLAIKGLGPKKVATLWKDLGVESPGELWYACHENRLIELSGFGPKTQADVMDKLRFYFEHRHHHLFANVEALNDLILSELKKRIGADDVVVTGGMRRADPVISQLEFLVRGKSRLIEWPEQLRWNETDGATWAATWEESLALVLHWQGDRSWAAALMETTGDDHFLRALKEKGAKMEGEREEDVFLMAGLPFIHPERRHEQVRWEDRTLVRPSDIKGVVHAHSTWSDGMNTMEEMAEACRKKGFEYLVMTDHSRAAFYANGLDEARVLAQFEEIDRLNAGWTDFHVYKGIESDILNDGSLDYSDELLSRFDLVIASVHSNLKMDLDKAMHRLLRAIEHPATKMLGHPTGRLLLARPGYPVDHDRLLDACAAHMVSIEINANPLRLDLDWTWVRKAIDKGIRISINPDAHSIAGIDDIRYGVLVARKAGVSPGELINTRDRAGFELFLKTRQ